MKILARLCVLGVAMLPFLSVSARDGEFAWFWETPNISVITNGDLTRAGAEFPRASREHPVYYRAVSMGYVEFGQVIPGEKKPADAAMMALVKTTLAGQGYLVASEKNPPTMMIVVGWGTLNAARSSGPFDGPKMPVISPHVLRFLGGGKMGLGETSQLLWQGELPLGLTGINMMARDFSDRFGADDHTVIKLSGYSLGNATTKPTLLWTTRIAAPSRGYYISELAGPMLAVAASEIGRQTDKPVVVMADERFHPSVEVGMPSVVNERVER